MMTTENTIIHTVCVDTNTFNFYVSRKKTHKLVIVKHITDWTGTPFENDPVLSEPTTWTLKYPADLNDIACVNRAGKQLLEKFEPLGEKS